MGADTVRILPSDKQSVFLLAVSRNNPSLNKIKSLQNNKAGLVRWTLVLAVLLPSYFAYLMLLLDNELAELNCLSV